MGDLFDLLGDCQVEDPDAFRDDPMESDMTRLSDIDIGSEFSVSDDEHFILLEKCNDGGSIVVRKDFLPQTSKFGDTADWRNSVVRSNLNGQYYEQLSNIIGAENIMPMYRDLTSLDGLDDYGACMDNVSLMTVAEYGRYHRILGVNVRYPKWQSLITPFSTPSNGYSRRVCYVGSFGTVGWTSCDFDFGVRPFLKINSSILVSIEDEENNG